MSKKHSPSSPQAAAPAAADVPYPGSARRGFFMRFFTGSLSVLLGAIPLGIGLSFFLDPLLRKSTRGTSPGGASDSPTDDRRKDADGFLQLDLTVAALPADGTPVAYKVHDDKVDAWNRFRHVEVGTIWLRRVNESEVVALNAICPHLGCAVDFRNSRGDFYCPCHTSSFNLDGERTNLIPPRGMDRLEVRLKPETGDSIWLKYQNFRAGTPEMTPIS